MIDVINYDFLLLLRKLYLYAYKYEILLDPNHIALHLFIIFKHLVSCFHSLYFINEKKNLLNFQKIEILTKLFILIYVLLTMKKMFI